MALDKIRIGFLPLVDAALPILAREQGFAEAEGLELELVRDMTWATVRDRLLYGHTDAAHLVAPLAIATALGRGRPAAGHPGRAGGVRGEHHLVRAQHHLDRPRRTAGRGEAPDLRVDDVALLLYRCG